MNGRFANRTLKPVLRRSASTISCVVAVPVCNERDRILDCLEALAAQIGLPDGAVGLYVFLNNCTDGTQDIVERWARSSHLPTRVVARDDPAASAGWARRQAMDAGAVWLEETASTGAFLLTTDADSRVAPDWVARNRAALAAGADAVAGCVAFDPVDIAALPPSLRQRQELEARYACLLAEIGARLAPRHCDPWPCHSTESGASIAVSLQAYRRSGGIPPLPNGEDHAFIDLLTTQGFAVRHAPDVVVTTSGRLDGRAEGGTAATLRLWDGDPESPCDDQLQSVAIFVLRIMRQKGGLHHSTSTWRRALRPSELPRQISRARVLLRFLRWLERRRDDRPRTASRSPERPKRLSMP